MSLKGLSPEDFKDKHEPSPEIRHLRKKVVELENKIGEIREGEGELEHLLVQLGVAVESAEPYSSQYEIPTEEKKITSPVEAVLECNDWHFGAIQDEDEIENLNSFSPEIATERILSKLVPAFIKWIEAHRSNYLCNKLRILSLGDMISGDIHDELKITNAFPSPVQAVKVAYLFADMVRMLSPFFSEIEIDYLTADNHGRLTRKPQAKEEGLNNYGYVTAYLAQEILRNHPNVQFNVHPKYQTVVDVSGFKYLISHGHNIRSWMGTPYYGVERQVGKEARKRIRAVQEIREKVRFDKMAIAHFHSPANMDDWMIGGSLSGTDAFDHKCGRYSTPCQTAWLVHPKHGEFDWTVFRL